MTLRTSGLPDCEFKCDTTGANEDVQFPCKGVVVAPDDVTC